MFLDRSNYSEIPQKLNKVIKCEIILDSLLVPTNTLRASAWIYYCFHYTVT